MGIRFDFESAQLIMKWCSQFNKIDFHRDHMERIELFVCVYVCLHILYTCIIQNKFNKLNMTNSNIVDRLKRTAVSDKKISQFFVQINCFKWFYVHMYSWQFFFCLCMNMYVCVYVYGVITSIDASISQHNL